MAYATSNPIKKISQMGDSNSLWYYSDGDAIGTIDDADYFLAATGDLNAGDVIIVNSGGSNGVVDIVIVSAATASTVTVALLA
ncbi:hypothetical protein [uncultured Mediterranean phage uvMED]|jgi:hypothetical protein|nr:hypothetical protein [uncultured Mediterranean phage uvMED]